MAKKKSRKASAKPKDEAPLPELAPIELATISREFTDHGNGVTEEIVKFLQPPTRWRGPLRIIAVYPERDVLSLSDGTYWRYEPGNEAPAEWLVGHLVAVTGRGDVR